jgi:hypothetical protein
LFIGPGDYSQIITTIDASVILTADSTGAFPLTKVGFGQMNFSSNAPSSAYFQQLGYVN